MNHWMWLTLGVVLALVETLAPGFFFLWLGIGAACTGLVVWLMPALDWEWQLLAFAMLALAAVLAWFGWRRRNPPAPPDPTLNRRAAQQVGAIGTLVEPLAAGRGRVKLGDTTWPAVGPDLGRGTRVRVAGIEDGRLVVERADERG